MGYLVIKGQAGEAGSAFPKALLARPDPWLSCMHHVITLKMIGSVTLFKAKKPDEGSYTGAAMRRERQFALRGLVHSTHRKPWPFFLDQNSL